MSSILTANLDTMLPREIIDKIPSSYEKALASGDLFFFPSSIHHYLESGVEYEIRLCPALQRKPHLPTPHFDENVDVIAKAVENGAEKSKDPFSPPYNAGLFVGYLEEDYVVLLNKYAVVAEHFLVVTKEFRSQSSPPTPSDLKHSYALLVAASKARKNMICIYNCGDLSGASQPHKHLQFIPLENEDGPPIEALARNVKLENPDKPFSINSLPYANHVYRFPSRLASSKPEEYERTLTDAFISLLDLAISTIRHDPDYPAGKASYNVILTLEHLYIFPRKGENYTLSSTGGILSINSLGYAGMLLVKSEEELEAVKKEGVGKILGSVGLKSVHEIQVAGVNGDHDGLRL